MNKIKTGTIVIKDNSRINLGRCNVSIFSKTFVSRWTLPRMCTLYYTPPPPQKKTHNTQDITRQSKSCYITAWGNSKINSNLGVSIRFDFKSEVAQSIFKFSVCRHNHVVKWRPCTLLQATIDNESSWYEGSIRKKEKENRRGKTIHMWGSPHVAG